MNEQSFIKRQNTYTEDELKALKKEGYTHLNVVYNLNSIFELYDVHSKYRSLNEAQANLKPYCKIFEIQ